MGFEPIKIKPARSSLEELCEQVKTSNKNYELQPTEVKHKGVIKPYNGKTWRVQNLGS